ncbi:DNA cytosine methyltransferase [Kribbella sp. VKM Ac-2568]|uniref:DNA cytosine methyltransferase n=1 Tax=Kribbella sp. VKM Ac-2568 TaxID=2512219 RepID=UPI0010527BD3|nr:DNA cytosine methyltransferase [Kribbella sp. VKM Ac-2568]TCM39650.1 DNA (cytosine-5)-methyltransferase 1 [Kribbella sp. VKM Ac-2568]
MTTAGQRKMGVKLVRGPFVRLEPHPEHCTTEESYLELCDRLRKKSGQLLAADLFAGAGGLSHGLEQSGMRVVLAADHDTEALETHRHHFGGLMVDWDLGDPRVVEKVAHLVKKGGVDVLAGGPPCQPFSKAGRSGIRHRVRQGLREPIDQRRDLWRSFLEVVRLAGPSAVIMENVPDMALDREIFILRTMVLELEQMGYAVEERIVDTWRYGVPQFRQRLILVALRDRQVFEWPAETEKKVTVSNAISDLPPVAGGWRPAGGAEGWAEYDGPVTEFQKAMRRQVDPDAHKKVYDHITRPVREDDAVAFELLGSNMRYSELPDELKRYRDDIFDDKYKRLDGDDLSRTITAHIAKDGYWYIHPVQNRTLTIREAARLQTFPDHFRFAGPPSAAFRQIGNAVPPRLGAVIGAGIQEALGRGQRADFTSEELAASLAAWFQATEHLFLPWLKAENRWQVLMAERLLDRAPTTSINSLWPLLQRWKSPRDVADHQEELLMMGGWIGREGRASAVGQIATALTGRGEPPLDDATVRQLATERLVTEAEADLASLVVPEGAADDGEEPVLVTKGVLRVAARFVGETIDRRNRKTDGRLAVARMIGYGFASRQAHLALIELASDICGPTEPACDRCPLSRACSSSPVTMDAAGSSV